MVMQELNILAEKYHLTANNEQNDLNIFDMEEDMVQELEIIGNELHMEEANGQVEFIENENDTSGHNDVEPIVDSELLFNEYSSEDSEMSIEGCECQTVDIYFFENTSDNSIDWVF